MPTQCRAESFGFGTVEGRAVVASFTGGRITADAGAVLLGATDRAIRLVDRFAACFQDARSPHLVEHSVATLVGQRVFALALGYEDLIDHHQLRHDPMFAVLVGKRAAGRSGCAPVAGKSTLNQLQHAPGGPPTRYHKISHDGAAIERLLVELFVDADAKPPKQITLDLDATDVPLHGHHEGRFFHGYYDAYCYLPLYIFCGRHLLAAKLRRANIDGSAGAVEEVERIVTQIRARWPRVRLLLRADSGFAREALMGWCERNRVDYVFGLARNRRLEAEIAIEMAWAEEDSRATGQPARRFKDFRWTTRDSWSRRRRVIGKAEGTCGEGNPRFIVTALTAAQVGARDLYERVYCARGEAENRITECQLDLFGDRTSAADMKANQLRLWFASMAYVLLCALRRIGLAPHSVRRGHLRYPQAAPAQNRRPRAHLRPPRHHRHGLRFPRPAGVRPGPRPPDRRPITTQTAPAAIGATNAAEAAMISFYPEPARTTVVTIENNQNVRHQRPSRPLSPGP